ncbi:glycosyltransferase family 9 protein, partial [candidate division KSB1 bacterium]
EMAGIIQKCDLVISNNTGNKHISDALGLPTITICGSSSPLTWVHPDSTRRRFLHTIVPCADCGLKECFHQSCMEEITTEQIIHEMHQIKELDNYIN